MLCWRMKAKRSNGIACEFARNQKSEQGPNAIQNVQNLQLATPEPVQSNPSMQLKILYSN
jgi:hypothetical protein